MENSDLEKLVMDVRELLARLDARMGNVEASLDRDFHLLHGNGQPGICDRVTKLEEAQKSAWHTIRTVGTLLLSLASMAVSVYVALRGR